MSDDLISRQAAIETILPYCPDDDGTCSKCGDDLRNLLDDIENLPSAQPEQRWIPVTEQLPKLGEKVLVSTKSTVFTQVFKRIYGTPDRWGWEHNTIKKVIAWMPLPEPYKEGK